MATEKKPMRRRVYSLAGAIGLALGSMGVASAATGPAQAPVPAPSDTVATAPAQTAPAEAEGAEAPGDEDLDGIDYQFEGEEVGDNGDGVAGPDEATEAAEEAEAPEATEAADEAEAPGDEELDGIDHEFEGEEIGDNGDGVADADDANEAAEATTNG